MFCGIVLVQVFVILATVISDAIGGSKKCVLHYELQSYDNRLVDYAEAKGYCRDSGRYLAKISTTGMSAALIEVLTRQDYYIGLKLSGDGIYRWNDGEQLGSHQNWESSNGLACVIADGAVRSKWKGVGCSFKAYYVCQRTLTASATIGSRSFVVDEDNKEIICSTPRASICVTTVTWFDPNGNELPASLSSEVYQEKAITTTTTPSQSISKLVFVKPNISQEGSYVCKVQVGTGSASEASKTVGVSMSATPTITDLILSECSSRMNISWTPSLIARSYPHLLKFIPTENTTEIIKMKFNASETYNAALHDLKPSTNYSIEISVCKTNACSYRIPAKRIVTTEGKPGPVSSAKMSSLGSNCSIEWNTPINQWNKITGYKVHVIKQLAESRSSTTNNSQWYEANNTSYVFVAQPNMKYFAEIQAANCAGTGEAVKATGFCTGAAKGPNYIERGIITHSNGVTINVTIKIPDETNGLISCLLVIVSDKNSNITQLISEGIFGITGEYYAIAIEPFKFVGKKNIEMELGDNSTSYCVLKDAHYDRSITSGQILRAINKPLRQDKEYKVTVAAAVPTSKNRYTLKLSGGVIVDHKESETKPTTSTNAAFFHSYKTSHFETTAETHMTSTSISVTPKDATLTSEANLENSSCTEGSLIDARYLAALLIIVPFVITAYLLGKYRGKRASRDKQEPIEIEVTEEKAQKETQIPNANCVELEERATSIPVSTVEATAHHYHDISPSKYEEIVVCAHEVPCSSEVTSKKEKASEYVNHDLSSPYKEY